MEIRKIGEGGSAVAVVSSGEACVTDGQTALDMLATAGYDTGSSLIAIYKQALTEDFFKLSTGIAGDVLQKVVNYNFKLAIIGDFSGYTSKPLKDFIYESNKGNSVFFVSSEQEAIDRLRGNRI